MKRRYLVIMAAAVVLCIVGLTCAACKRTGDGPERVFSDVDELRSVIILSPAADERKEAYALYADSPLVSLGYFAGMVGQHRELSNLLKNRGVRVLDAADLLEGAISNARTAGQLESALAGIFPDEFPRLKNELPRITAKAVLGRDPGFFFRYAAKGALDPLVPTSGAFFFTRDFAVSTPAGIIITNSRSKWRRYEHRIGRFLFRFCRELESFPIVFDAEAEGVRCEGGDIIVKDERTLLMGIGNLSDREAASKIAMKLGLDVIGVSMPPIEAFSGVNFEIMHLDTVFNFVDRKKVLTVPYFFLKRYAEDNPVVKYLQAVQARPVTGSEKGEIDLPTSLKMALDSIPKVGWLTQFSAGTGEAQELGKKLGDYLLEQGYDIIPVGGERGDMREDLYIDDRVLYELSLQAANIVQLSPGKVLAYSHNRYTNEALRKKGIQVLTFEGKYLADSLGGPHCLTMPLVRTR
jgi:arginine deiminase